METETNAATRLDEFRDGVEVRHSAGGYNTLVVDRADGEMVILSDGALQKLVQWAYEQRGILAAPSYDVEAERAPELDPLQMIHDHANKAHAQQAESRLPDGYLDALAKQPRSFA